jgi:hypothetical protein
MFGIDSIKFNRADEVDLVSKVKVSENIDSDFVESLLIGCQMHFDDHQIKFALDPYFESTPNEGKSRLTRNNKVLKHS